MGNRIQARASFLDSLVYYGCRETAAKDSFLEGQKDLKNYCQLYKSQVQESSVFFKALCRISRIRSFFINQSRGCQRFLSV
jgi:hypothetical protein